jgi:hypothetical protein
MSACTCSRARSTGSRFTGWGTIASAVFAAVLPKCPLCLIALLGAVGATRLEPVLPSSPVALFAITVAMLALVVGWFGLRLGAKGMGIAAVAAIAILCGKYLFSSAALVGFGPVLLSGYVVTQAVGSRRIHEKRSA